MYLSKRSVCWILGLSLCLPMPSAAANVAQVDVGATAVHWDVQGDFAGAVLTVSLPNGQVIRRELAAGAAISFQLDGAAPDGTYTYELRATPRIDSATRRELEAARKSGKEADAVEKLRSSGKLPRENATVQSGAFTVENGTIVAPDLQEEKPRKSAVSAAQGGRSGGVQIITAADQVIPDDLIVQGSTCVGFDCVNNESFGFDTIRLKENNTRIKFEDTSVGNFPANDWQLTANDSASGGSNKFSIEDITGAKVPFTITGGAATNSVFVDSTGRVGFRTSTPVLDLHVSTSNTPALRLEQNNSGGFTAQTWDVAGNEANFFVRDVTGGSRLPFRIRPGAPTSSIDISASGNVGIGTASPSEELTVLGSDGDTKVLIQESSATSSSREIFEMKNNGGVVFILDDTGRTSRWANGTFVDSFVMDEQATPGTEFQLTNNGNLTVSGTVNGSSDRNMKKDIFPVRREEILAKLISLPISTWTYKTENVRHLGPMAQDFSAAFGLGMDDKHIALTDMAGVTIAAVQALNEQVEEKDKEISDLKSRLEALEKLVANLAQPKN